VRGMFFRFYTPLPPSRGDKSLYLPLKGGQEALLLSRGDERARTP